MRSGIEAPNTIDKTSEVAHMSGTERRCFVQGGHLFVILEEGTFLVDTGAPASFGRIASLVLEGQRFTMQPSYMGMTADQLSSYVSRETDGLIGTDILNRFDILLDVPNSRACFSTATLTCEGERLPLDFVMNVPILTAVIDATPMKLFFDTGAQLSYLQGESLCQYPPEGSETDFYPGFGSFTTDTFRVPLQFGRTMCKLRCGRLPEILGMTLMLAGTEGIVGNELLRGRRVGYFPRHGCLTLGASSD